jgi:hypothetical protein
VGVGGGAPGVGGEGGDGGLREKANSQKMANGLYFRNEHDKSRHL